MCVGHHRAALATFDELVEYCRRVAGSVGRLSLSIYGSSDPDQRPR